jgi:hypothetical protein
MLLATDTEYSDISKEASRRNEGKRPKKADRIAQLVFGVTFLANIADRNVLVIGSSKGLAPLSLCGANVVWFTEASKSRGRWKNFQELDDYRELLTGKFDLVVSREYDPSYLDFCTFGGYYLTQSIDTENIEKAICCSENHCVLLSQNISTTTSQTFKELDGTFRDALANMEKAEEVYIPNISRIHSVAVDDSAMITHKGLRTSPATSGLLDFYNNVFSVYNPTYTTYTGIIDCYHRFPSTAFLTIDQRAEQLRQFGFSVTEEGTARGMAERIAKKYEFLTTPLMPLLPQQALAYVQEGDRVARADVPRLGIEQGKEYFVRVGWRKRKDGKYRKGYMTVTVNGFTLWEDKEEDVQDYIEAFGLPVIGSVEDRYSEIVSAWKKKLAGMFPALTGFQLEGLSLACTRPTIYNAYDKGLGKTFMSAAWAAARGYKRVLVAAQRKYLDKWRDELEKFGFAWKYLLDWKSVNELKEQIKSGVKNKETVFYLCSFEFLGLESNVKMDPWICTEKDDKGYLKAVVRNITGRKCPSCGKTVAQARLVCPHCDSTDYTGKYCRSCKRPTYSYVRKTPLTPERSASIEQQARSGKCDFHSGTYPAYKKLKKLFTAVIVDEAQEIKNKNTLRSTATRSLKAKGKALVTATLIKNYPNELFWPVAWLLGFNNPMFPYAYKGGFPAFERQFGTEFHKGNVVVESTGEAKEIWSKIPEVSNLTILWKLLAPFMVRKLKASIEGIKPPTIEAVTIGMDEGQQAVYSAVREKKLDELAKELEKQNPDAHVIRANLWSLRAASTVPTARRYFPPIDCEYSGVWPKLAWVIEKMKELKARGEKALIFSTLVDMAECVKSALDCSDISSIRIQRKTKNRLEIIKRFNEDTTSALISSPELIGRSYDIYGATTVIFTDVGFTPEEHEQAMDRAHRPLIKNTDVSVYFLLSRRTIDEHMFELIVQKGEAIKNVMDRRAVYQPSEILREAVQIQIARRIIENRGVDIKVKRTFVEQQSVKELKVNWPTINTIVHTEQLGLFS